MQEENQVGGTDEQTNGSAEVGENSQTQGKDDHVPKSAYEQVTKDLHKWKAQAKENQRQLSEVQDRLKAFEDKNIDETDLKQVAERYKRDADSYKAENQKLKESYLYSEKYRAIFNELRKLGFRDDAERYLEFEDLKDIEIETTSKGRVNVLGAQEWAAEYQRKNEFLFEAKKAPKVSSADGRSGNRTDSEPLTPAKLIELEKIARRTGKADDDKKYREAVLQYQKSKGR